jgi:hypothetical protein
MSWLAGYHNSSGEHHDEIRPTWHGARKVIVGELDQRIMAIEADPSGVGDEEELDDLRAARAMFAGLNYPEQGAVDASGLTFVLVPGSAVAVRNLVEEVLQAATPAARNEPLFPLGQLVATPGAIEVMERLEITPLALLSRHVSGDWGDIDPEDKGLNEQALEIGERIFSVYGPEDDRLWVITEADRSATTILRPEDY